MDRFEQQIAEHETSLESLFSACEKLNEIAQVAQESLKDGGLHPTALPYCNIALESYGGVALEDSALMTLPRQQTTGDVVKAAVEGVKKVLQHIFELMKKMWESFRDYVKSLTSKTQSLIYKSKELAKEVRAYSGPVNSVQSIDSNLSNRLVWKGEVNYDFTEGLRLYQKMVEEVSVVTVDEGSKMALSLTKLFNEVMSLKSDQLYRVNTIFVVPRIAGFTTEPVESEAAIILHRHVSPELPGDVRLKFTTLAVGGFGTARHIFQALSKVGILVERDHHDSDKLEAPRPLTLAQIEDICTDVAVVAEHVHEVIHRDTSKLDMMASAVNGTRKMIEIAGSSMYAVDMARALKAIHATATQGHLKITGQAFSYAMAVYQLCLQSYNAQVKA